MKILMTGATGLVGTYLGKLLHDAGHEISIVTRSEESARKATPYPARFINCNLQTTALNAKDFKGIDAIINLIGESIDGRWTPQKKKDILESRTLSANNLLKNCPPDMPTIISTSAQGFYGNTGEENVNEQTPAGSDFLAEVCQQWEAPFTAWQAQHKTRVVILRLGMVLSHRGGALKKLISLFQKNLGAVLGSGQQWMSFISLEDLARIYEAALTHSEYVGEINAVTAYPVRNREFTAQLTKALETIQLPKVPKFVLKALLGEMSALVLNSTKVEPVQLQKLNFQFNTPRLADVFARELSEFKDVQR